MTHQDEFSCKTSNIIYLITCKKCDIQYVGLTDTPLHVRMNSHRSKVNNVFNNLYLTQHFSEEGHDFNEATFQIIDYIDSGSVGDSLGDKEQFWIKTLNTAYPLGLNDNIKSQGNVSQGRANLAYFRSTNITRYKRGHGNKSKRSVWTLPSRSVFTQTFIGLKNKLKYNKKEFSNCLNSYNKRFLTSLIKHCEHRQGFLLSIISSFFKHKYNKFLPKDNDKSCSKKERETITFHFESKAMDDLNLKSLFLDTRLQKLLPGILQDKLPLSLRFSFDPSLGRKIANYASVLKDLNQDNLKQLVTEDCNCSSSEFIYEPHGHIVTGDLSIIGNNKLRDLMEKGTKFREPRFIEASQLRSSILSSLDDFILKLCKKYKTEKIHFEDWKTGVQTILDNMLNFLQKYKPWLFKAKPSVLKHLDVKESLIDLQKKYVFCSIDKAANNFVIVCKKFYVLTLMKELGVDGTHFNCLGNQTYSPVLDNETEIVEKHCRILQDKFGIIVKDVNKKLPRIFWNPKLHKVPYKARFIAGATNCSTKQLSILVTKALQVLLGNFKLYCRGILRNCGINCDWGINSTEQFLDKLRKLKDIYSVQVHDFSTLYTNLDLKFVKEALVGMIDLIFNKDKNKFINISLFKGMQFFHNKKYSGFFTFDKTMLKEAVFFILDNAYVVFGDFVLLQLWGIPMGGNCSTEIANCTLGWFEYIFMTNILKKKDYSKRNLLKVLSNNSRFVDDLISFNYKNFGNLYSEIYPSGLLMERSGDNDKCVNYLDTTLTLDNKGSYSTQVYCKQDSFDFSVVQYTFPSSNMPLDVGYNVFYGQILRLAKLNSEKDDFILASKKLFDILYGRGYQVAILKKKFRKVLGKYPEIISKYGVLDSGCLQHSIFDKAQ